MEKYLSEVKCIKKQVAITKFNLFDHKLEIDIGRYHRPKKKPEERVCHVCNTTEDEVHCLMTCKFNESLRSQFFQEITKRLQHGMNSKWMLEKRFIFIMKTSELNGNQPIYDFIDQCL